MVKLVSTMMASFSSMGNGFSWLIYPLASLVLGYLMGIVVVRPLVAVFYLPLTRAIHDEEKANALAEGRSHPSRPRPAAPRRRRPLQAYLSAPRRRPLLPRYLTVPDFDSCEWISSLLVTLWPRLAEAFPVDVLPAFTQLPAWLVITCDLGTAAPRVGAMKTYARPGGGIGHRADAGEEKITVETNLLWSRDVDLRVGWRLPSWGPLARCVPPVLPLIAVSRLALAVPALRLTLGPLTDTLPIVSAVDCTLVEPPLVEFRLHVPLLPWLGDITTFPVLGDVLHAGLHATLQYLMGFPRFYTFTLDPTAGRQPEGIVTVTGLRVEHLETRKWFGVLPVDVPDPYVKVSLRPTTTPQLVGSDNGNSGTGGIRRTRTFRNAANAAWNDRLRFLVHSVARESVTIDLHDAAVLGEGPRLARVVVPVPDPHRAVEATRHNVDVDLASDDEEGVVRTHVSYVPGDTRKRKGARATVLVQAHIPPLRVRKGGKKAKSGGKSLNGLLDTDGDGDTDHGDLDLNLDLAVKGRRGRRSRDPPAMLYAIVHFESLRKEKEKGKKKETGEEEQQEMESGPRESVVSDDMPLGPHGSGSRSASVSSVVQRANQKASPPPAAPGITPGNLAIKLYRASGLPGLPSAYVEARVMDHASGRIVWRDVTAIDAKTPTPSFLATLAHCGVSPTHVLVLEVRDARRRGWGWTRDRVLGCKVVELRDVAGAPGGKMGGTYELQRSAGGSRTEEAGQLTMTIIWTPLQA